MSLQNNPTPDEQFHGQQDSTAAPKFRDWGTIYRPSFKDVASASAATMAATLNSDDTYAAMLDKGVLTISAAWLSKHSLAQFMSGSDLRKAIEDGLDLLWNKQQEAETHHSYRLLMSNAMLVDITAQSFRDLMKAIDNILCKSVFSTPDEDGTNLAAFVASTVDNMGQRGLAGASASGSCLAGGAPMYAYNYGASHMNPITQSPYAGHSFSAGNSFNSPRSPVVR